MSVTRKMLPLWYRAERAGEQQNHRLEKRLLRKLIRRIEKTIPEFVDGRRRMDWHDMSIEIYGCEPEFKLTPAQVKRVLGLGVHVIYCNFHGIEFVYSTWDGKPHVRDTGRDAFRKRLPDEWEVVGNCWHRKEKK